MLTADPVLSARETNQRYEVLRTVNRGGMGEIAMARVRGTKGFEKLVVLKRLRADAEREDHVAMFDVEQEVMSRIEHPNIVKVFDQPIVEGIPYLAMEYVRGRNLDQLIRSAQQNDEKIPYGYALTMIAEVLRGLAFVHRLKDSDGRALGVVHQDMTPSNVMLSFFGEVKITDFGISYVTSRDGGLRKGVLKGKPRYVAPEVLANRRVNNRADIYGVGTILYEILKGQALFARSSVKETLAAVARNELPDFAEEFPEQGQGLVDILTRSLAKEPAERYRTAEEMAADVLHELMARGGPVAPASLGLLLRRLFRDDPDVPEMDPAFEAALVAGEVKPEQAKLEPRNLDETLQELDRLLGPTGQSTSFDVFEIPDEVDAELSDMADNDPFMALTPIPDFVWDAKDENELLNRARDAFKETKPLVETRPSPARAAAAPAPTFANEAGTPSIELPEPPPRAQGGEYSVVRNRPTTPPASVPTSAPTAAPVSAPAGQPAVEPTPGGESFWMGLGLGVVAGAGAGAVLTAYMAGMF